MAKKKVVIMGAMGMLGSMVLDTFASNGEFAVTATYRDHKALRSLKNKYPKVEFRKLNVEKTSLQGILKAIKGADWVVNAIGVTKPYIHDDNTNEIYRAVYVNAVFPHLLAQAAGQTKAKVIQIATDCVYSGQKGRYVETDPHDGLDVYGKTKSLGVQLSDRNWKDIVPFWIGFWGSPKEPKSTALRTTAGMVLPACILPGFAWGSLKKEQTCPTFNTLFRVTP